MEYLKKKDGFNIVELLVVLSISVLVLYVGASSFSDSIALRRSVDELTNSIGSSINLIKIQSSRQGVEYRLVLSDCTSVDSSDPDCEICNTYEDYQSGDPDVVLIIERGDSNVGSGVWCMEEFQRKNMLTIGANLVMSANIDTGPINVSVAPSGMRSDFRNDLNVESLSVIPGGGAKVDKCGVVELTTAGALRTIQGRWDGSVCNAILDAQPTPGPS